MTHELVEWMDSIHAIEDNHDDNNNNINHLDDMKPPENNGNDSNRFNNHDSVDVLSTLFQTNVIDVYRHELFDIALTRLVAVIAMDFTSVMRNKLFKENEWYVCISNTYI